MIEAITQAQDHINLETYIFDDDEVGQRFVQALIAKQSQGVQVNLMRDSVGTIGTPPPCSSVWRAAACACSSSTRSTRWPRAGPGRSTSATTASC